MNPAAGLRLLLDQTFRRVSLDWHAHGAGSTAHRWTFANGFTLLATPSPEPGKIPPEITPEELQLARVASCHLLAWLRLAALIGAQPCDYRDEAAGMLFRPAPGAPWDGAITLDPRVAFTKAPATPDAVRRLHELAHARHFDPREIRLRVAIRGIVELPALPVAQSTTIVIPLPRQRAKKARRKHAAVAQAA